MLTSYSVRTEVIKTLTYFFPLWFHRVSQTDQLVLLPPKLGSCWTSLQQKPSSVCSCRWQLLLASRTDGSQSCRILATYVRHVASCLVPKTDAGCSLILRGTVPSLYFLECLLLVINFSQTLVTEDFKWFFGFTMCQEVPDCHSVAFQLLIEDMLRWYIRVQPALLHQPLLVISGATNECTQQSPWCLLWNCWFGVHSWIWRDGNWPIWSGFLLETTSWTLPVSRLLARVQRGWGSYSSWCHSANQSTSEI